MTSGSKGSFSPPVEGLFCIEDVLLHHTATK
jgi:hypothetical protein